MIMAQAKRTPFKTLAGLALVAVVTSGCANFGPKASTPALALGTFPDQYPEDFAAEGQPAAPAPLESFFQDPTLLGLIKEALENNQERALVLQELRMAKNEVQARGGELWPFLRLGGGWDREKVGRYTRHGAVEESLELTHEKNFPDPLSNFRLGAQVSWEVDIWRRLRNERDSAIMRYLSSLEGQRFMVTHLIAEVAETYYALRALDSRLAILNNTIGLQKDALALVRLQKDAAVTTQLAVTKFEAEVLKNQSERVVLQQERVQEENRLHFLLGRYPTELTRPSEDFADLQPPSLAIGLPTDLLRQRPDVRAAERAVQAAALDVAAARARFYPALDLSAAFGAEAFQLGRFDANPASRAYGIGVDFLAPLLNRAGLKAAYGNATAEQEQALLRYQQTSLKAYLDVLNQLNALRNLSESATLKAQQVATLGNSVEAASRLFSSARADYMEVLMTQRDALESRLDLIDLREQQFQAAIRAYAALGGGAPAPDPS
jgi:NodT family efflux transporter outer membrane factor (OMF) lipoprotein